MTFLHIEEESGSVRLTDCRDTINTSIPIITIDGVVIAKSSYSDHYFYGLNIEDGSINWIFGDEDSAVNALFFDQEDRTLYLNVKKNANDAGDIVALHATTGKMAWTGTLAEVNSIVSDYYGYYFDGQGKFEFQNEYIIYENLRTRQEVMIFSTVNGQLLNSINSARSIWVYFADEGLISYSKDLGVLTGVDYLTGDELWSNDEITLYTFGPFNHTSIGDVVILVDDERQLIAINQTTGEKLWTKPQNELDEEQPTISYNGKLVYINDQNLIFLDPESGNTERIDIGKAATQINNTGHIEMINQSSWLLCGQFLSLVTMKE